MLVIFLILSSLNQKLQDKVLNLVTDTKNDEFARELAEGLSYSIACMDDKSQIRLLALIKKKDQSSISLPEHIENRNLTADFVYINEAFSTLIVPNYNS